MKYLQKSILRAAALLAVLLSLVLPQSCDHFGQDEDIRGGLVFHFADNFGSPTKSARTLPDTSDFLLKVTGEDGKSVYDGLFGDSPETLFVEPGTYTVSVRSGKFKGPAFNSPLFGDDEVVVVPSKGIEEVTLTCSQVNSGIRLAFYDTFVRAYPKAFIYVSSAGRSLLYKYREERVAYCEPGAVSVLMEDESGSTKLFTRDLAPREILTVKISAPEGAGAPRKGDITIDVDTTRNWTNADWTIGSGDPDDGEDSGEDGSDVSGDDEDEGWKDAMNVNTARKEARSGAEDVWVYGYIVGCFRSAGHLTANAPFDNNTNVAIASRRSTTSASSCIAVFLPKGKLRDELNLQDNPSLEGAKVWFKGTLTEKYFGVTGLKSVSACHLEE